MTTTATHSPLAAFWQRHAFSIGDEDFHWLDVALAAMAHGDWARFERRLTEGLACAARAAAEHITMSDAAIDETATAFRYARDLISADEMSAWLAHAGVSTNDWMAYIARDVMRRVWAHEIDALLDRYPPSPRQLEAAAMAEGISSGLFEAFETGFSERAATAFDAFPDVFAAAGADPRVHADAAARLMRQHAHWLTGRPEADSLARLARILDIADAYRAASERLIGEESLQSAIESHRLDWIAVDLEVIALDDEGTAREAILCLREDGLSMQDVGALSHRTVARTRLLLEEVPAEYRDLLLSVEAGRLIGPQLVEGRYQVAVLLGRTTPALQDERIVQRARVAVLAVAGHRAARDHVKRRPTT